MGNDAKGAELIELIQHKGRREKDPVTAIDKIRVFDTQKLGVLQCRTMGASAEGGQFPGTRPGTGLGRSRDSHFVVAGKEMRRRVLDSMDIVRELGTVSTAADKSREGRRRQKTVRG